MRWVFTIEAFKSAEDGSNRVNGVVIKVVSRDWDEAVSKAATISDPRLKVFTVTKVVEKGAE